LLEAIMGAEAMGIVQVDLKVISPLLMQWWRQCNDAEFS
jgi:hypothetical protein